MIDYKEYDLAKILSRNKNRTYRESVLRDAMTLMSFLKKNALLLIDPFDEKGEVKADLVIRQSDLTEEGIKMFAGPIRNWWSYIDRGGKPDNIGHLEKGLEAIQKNKEE
jgi:hypothetical protein